MKKIIAVTLAALTLAVTMACAPTVEAESDPLFYMVSNERYAYIVYDKKTKVMYAVSNNSHGNGGVFTLLVDADGMPRLWEG